MFQRRNAATPAAEDLLFILTLPPLPRGGVFLVGRAAAVFLLRSRRCRRLRPCPIPPRYARPPGKNSRNPCRSHCASTAGSASYGADEIMANITAERLIENLERSGYVVMCKPGLAPHGAAGNLADAIEKAGRVDLGE